MAFWRSGTAWAEDAAIAPINQFVDALNAGDVKKAAATHVANAPIIDEFAPHHWTSLAGWLKGFMADSKMNKITDVHVTLQHATTSTVGAREAYEVVPNVITAKPMANRTRKREYSPSR
ncbi:MAG: hypothetical protein WDM89_21140 [Rhizomicrobium sp.]